MIDTRRVRLRRFVVDSGSWRLLGGFGAIIVGLSVALAIGGNAGLGLQATTGPNTPAPASLELLWELLGLLALGSFLVSVGVYLGTWAVAGTDAVGSDTIRPHLISTPAGAALFFALPLGAGLLAIGLVDSLSLTCLTRDFGGCTYSPGLLAIPHYLLAIGVVSVVLSAAGLTALRSVGGRMATGGRQSLSGGR